MSKRRFYFLLTIYGLVVVGEGTNAFLARRSLAEAERQIEADAQVQKIDAAELALCGRPGVAPGARPVIALPAVPAEVVFHSARSYRTKWEEQSGLRDGGH
ncbi:MAG TPA: hypothetical protein VGR03_11370 [Candidatus Acidoferrum sp.]|nr:hypothetical protein [Candidatus Acidoferrum sp.]